MLKKIFIVFLFLIFSFEAFAQADGTEIVNDSDEIIENNNEKEETEEKDTIIVTASKSDSTVESATVSAKVITSKEIEASGNSNFVDTLGSQSNLYVSRNGGKGGTSSLFLGGAPSEYTVVMFNGFKLNDVTQIGGGFNYSMLSTSGIKQIEILNGAQSTLYGSDAMAGIINIVPEDGLKNKGLDVRFEYGSYDSYLQQVSFGDSNDTGFIGVSAENFIIKGLSKAENPENDTSNYENDRDRMISSKGKGGIYLGKSAILSGVYFFSKSEVDVDDSAETDIEHNRNYENLILYGIEFEHELTEFYNYKFNSSITDTERIIDNKEGAYGPYHGEWIGKRINHEFENTVNIKKVYTANFGYQFEKYRYKDSSMEKKSESHSLYLQNIVSILDVLKLHAGGRFVKHGNSDSDIEISEKDNYTYQLGLNLKVPVAGTRFITNHSTGYKTPTIYQLYDVYNGNEDLKSEKSNTTSIGLFQPLLNRFEIGIQYRKSIFKDKIEWYQTGTMFGFPVGEYRNLDKVYVDEYTGSFQIKLNDIDYALFSGTYLKTHDENTDKKLARRPENKYHIMFNKGLGDKMSLSATYNYIGERYDDADNTKETKLDSYSRVDMNFIYKYSEVISANVRVENLLNEHYQEAYGYTAPGVSVYGGVKASL